MKTGKALKRWNLDSLLVEKNKHEFTMWRRFFKLVLETKSRFKNSIKLNSNLEKRTALMGNPIKPNAT